ncbi:choice-of-anchor D domain-containing protein, partial [Candidatus Poribacteria bacterium]|nr:choice-of-anchor D domain-containing protein [Candidatus Poribacteria bacterium]
MRGSESTRSSARCRAGRHDGSRKRAEGGYVYAGKGRAMRSRKLRALSGLVASVVLALFVCAGVSAQTSWTKYAGNPVFVGPTVSTAGPMVVFDGSQYRMWYNAGPDGSDIRYATSPDGISWTDNGFAVPRGDVTPQWVDTPAVIIDDGVYKMWYGGGTTAGGYGIVCYATSTDGVTWTKYASNPVFTKSGSEMHSGSVIKDGSTYKLWYHAYFGGSDPYIGYATSPDGISWTDQGVVLDQGSSGATDTNSVGEPSVLKRNGQYEMWYAGVNASNVQTINYATSGDGVTWTKYASNPVLGVGASGSWDAVAVMGPTVLIANGDMRMWFAAVNSVYGAGIGYATANPTASVTPTTVNAGIVTKPSSGTATFTITNTGGGTLTVSGITSSNSQFTVSPAPPYNLAAGQSQTVTVTFTPTVAGTASATLTITHNASGSPATVTASGVGLWSYQNWQATLRLTGDPAGDHTVIVGVAPDASDAVNLSAEDTLAPPMPQPPASWLRLLRGGQALSQDVLAFADARTWTIEVE